MQSRAQWPTLPHRAHLVLAINWARVNRRGAGGPFLRGGALLLLAGVLVAVGFGVNDTDMVFPGMLH